VEERETARRTRNWAAADELRGKIRELGFLVEDRQDGPLVKSAE
jgi:cysteinyl-tRNA synthetase